MSKEVEKRTCQHCESSYKLLFDMAMTTGYPRFCPFCAEETYDDDVKYDEDNEDE